MRRSSLDRSSEQKPRVAGAATAKPDPGERSEPGSDTQPAGMRSGRRIEGAPQAGDHVIETAGESASIAMPTSEELRSDTAPERPAATPGEIGDTGGATAQAARNEPGSRDGNRRMTRGNRLRRGLRSRRKTYRPR
jgi:hypothetical protein